MRRITAAGCCSLRKRVMDAGKKSYIVPIPGSRKTERLLENAGAADIDLTETEVAAIDSALNKMDLQVFSGVLNAEEE